MQFIPFVAPSFFTASFSVAEELVEHDPKGPPIDAFGVALPLDHLALLGEMAFGSDNRDFFVFFLKNMIDDKDAYTD